MGYDLVTALHTGNWAGLSRSPAGGMEAGRKREEGPEYHPV